MNSKHKTATLRCARGFLIATLLGSAASASAYEIKLELSGGQEVPAVSTAASGSGSLFVNANKQISGALSTTGFAGTMAHIHMGAAGKNGPVAIPLIKAGDANWTVPAGSTLSDEQYAAYKTGELYVNVHSVAHPGGEIRAQIKP